MWLRKDKGGCTVNGITWVKDGDVAEVPDGLGDYLLRIEGGGYSAAEAPPKPVKAAPAAKPAPAAEPPKPAAAALAK